MLSSILPMMKTLVTSPPVFMRDLANLGEEASQFAVFLVSHLWKKSIQSKGQNHNAKWTGFVNNMKILLLFGASLLCLFYADMFAFITEGFGFLLYNFYPGQRYALEHLGTCSYSVLLDSTSCIVACLVGGLGVFLICTWNWATTKKGLERGLLLKN